MVVQCPSCQSRFRIADEKVSARGVRVRCTSCKNVFQVHKPPEVESPQAAVAPEAVAAAAARTMPGPTIPARVPGPARSSPPADGTRSSPPLNASRSAPPGPVQRPSRPVLSAVPRRKTLPPVAAPPPPALDLGLDDGLLPPVPPEAIPASPAGRTPEQPQGEYDPLGLEGLEPPPRQPIRRTPSVPPGHVRRSGGTLPPRPALDEDDLFGMAELTGEAPARPPDLPADPPPGTPPSLGEEDAGSSSSPAYDNPFGARSGAASIDPPSGAQGALQSEPSLQAPTSGQGNPFDGFGADDPGVPQQAPAPFPSAARPPLNLPQRSAGAAASPPAEPVAPHHSARRVLIAALLDGMVGTAAVLLLLLAGGALFETDPTTWIPRRAAGASARRLASGLFETGSGKLVFFLRGRVENRGAAADGPFKVVVDLGDGEGVELRLESPAGTEPTPEEVFAVKNAQDVRQLTQSLAAASVGKRLQPGESVPFFVALAEPPPDIQQRRIVLRVEPLGNWSNAAGQPVSAPAARASP